MANILLIDDEENVRFSLRCALEQGGHEVFEASDGEEGVSQFKRLQASSRISDLIVTDIFMPEKDGFETINEIKRLSPKTKIIAISGGGTSQPGLFLDMSHLLGADQVLAKPFSSRELLDAVERCLA